jgi:hypothetical protein
VGYRHSMPKTIADEWFEDYLRDHGHDPGEHEPDLRSWDVATRPDFLPKRGTSQIACEVEQFGTASKLARRLAEQRTVAASDAEVYGPIRHRVGKAARQLKPLASRGLPLVVVLANPDGAPVDLGVDHVLAALYGNPRWTIPIDRTTGGAVDDGHFELGRDGKLTNDHPYLSAVVLLRRRELASDASERVLAEARRRFGNEPNTAKDRQARMVGLLEELNRHQLPEGHYFYVEVIEALSNSSTPLPECWFDGERDRRWRCNDGAHYELVHGEPRQTAP